MIRIRGAKRKPGSPDSDWLRWNHFTEKLSFEIENLNFNHFLFETQVDKVFNLFWFGSFWDWYFWEFSTKIQVESDLSPYFSDCWGVLDEDVLGLRTYKGWGRTWVHFEVKRVRSRWKWIVRSAAPKYSFWGFLLQTILRLTVHVIVRSLYRFEFIEF